MRVILEIAIFLTLLGIFKVLKDLVVLYLNVWSSPPKSGAIGFMSAGMKHFLSWMKAYCSSFLEF